MSKVSLRPIIRGTEATREGTSVETGSSRRLQSSRTRRNRMNDELPASMEREVLDWPGVSEKTRRGGRGQGRAGFGFHRRPSTSLAAARSGTSTTRCSGLHVPEGDPRRTDLRRTGEAARGRIRRRRELPHSGAGRRTRAVELFRMNYERPRARAGRRG
jgi:hypothetical protein